ncbi:hypothetical protein FHS16_002512 [Paenibacillus endophyticus]|uniref:Uncharacterized protein n=1 Tax=Paenibacillus endophyticus TaxID=1294268 RepID=A0A7W5C790_9BACL|nr:hypothetical protein [Paenibacillus endophyticus]MBB3152462.1 hypothetical protein [Paenibacillus endophyticus]
MSNEATILSSETKKKKTILKKWWFWVIAIIVLFIVILAASDSTDESIVYELGQVQAMNKQEIVEKFGKPSEVVRDDAEGYLYSYDSGFTINGNDSEAASIMLSNELVKGNAAHAFKIFDIQLNSTFSEHVKRLGNPSLQLVQDNRNLVAYLTNEGALLTFTSTSNEDKVTAIELSPYDSSSIAMALDISSLLHNQTTEEEIKKSFVLKEKSTDATTTLYIIEGFQIIVDNKSHTVTKVIINTDSVYNVAGLRPTDSLDKANRILGTPTQSKEGIKNTTQYLFNSSDAVSDSTIIVSADNSSNIIQYVELSVK